MTIPTQHVLHALLADPSKELYGVEIGQAAGLPSGTVHPILARLETVGWLTSRWEEIGPRAEGRPARRYYRLTPDGIELARGALARLETVGWLTSRWEDIDPRAEGRPARRYYRLTPDGIELARGALARAYTATARPAWLRPQGEQS